MQKSYEQRLSPTLIILSLACCLQYNDVLRPSALYLGRAVQESYEQRKRRTFTIPSLACCLQYLPVVSPSTLNCGPVRQEACAQRLLLRVFSIPSSACFLQYLPVSSSSKLSLGSVVHEAYGQRLLRMFTIPSSARRWQHTAAEVPSTLNTANVRRCWETRRGMLAKMWNSERSRAS